MIYVRTLFCYYCCIRRLIFLLLIIKAVSQSYEKFDVLFNPLQLGVLCRCEDARHSS